MVHVSRKTNVFNFFAAYILSAFGYEFIFFVMTIYVYDVSKSALNVGIFAALTFFPRLFAPFYGIIIDRYNRAKVFACVSSITGVLVTLIALNSQLAWIYLMWSLISVFLTFIFTVRTALMTEIMTQDNYLQGNSMVLIFLNLAKVCAPLLAGAASSLVSIIYLFYLTGAIFFGVTVFSALIWLPDTTTAKTYRKIVPDLKEGLKYIRENLDVRFLISVGVLWRLFIGLQVSLFVVYIKAYLSAGDTGYGMFMTAIGMGSIVGSIIGPRLVKRVEYSTVVSWGLSIHYASFVILGLLHDFDVALVVIFLSYIIFYATLVGLHSLRDKATRVDMRGRVYGSVTAILTPAAIFSMVTGGYLANLFGVEKVLIGTGILALVSFYLLNLAKGFIQDSFY